MQISLTGFLGKNASIFMEEFWARLVDAQSNSFGIPTAFLEKKKQELIQKNQSAVASAVSSTGPQQQTIGASVSSDVSTNEGRTRDSGK